MDYTFTTTPAEEVAIAAQITRQSLPKETFLERVTRLFRREVDLAVKVFDSQRLESVAGKYDKASPTEQAQVDAILSKVVVITPPASK